MPFTFWTLSNSLLHSLNWSSSFSLLQTLSTEGLALALWTVCRQCYTCGL